MAARTLRAERASATRESILATAERLFAERGLYTVSNRQISDAAGQGNNAAVGYHFGTKADLVRAIVRRHVQPIEAARARMAAAAAGSTEMRDWVACLVRPVTEHMEELGTPSWYARFGAQVRTDPAFREITVQESLDAPSLRQVLDGLNRCRPELPNEVRAERDEMAGNLITHTCAERERALADGLPTPRASWHDTATGLVDAIVGMWSAPVTH